jgi:glyoxylase-like metal-dependent hydrolase (beta-lactamase superfamily II)
MEIYEGWRLNLIRGDYDLFPGLRILHTPGHTPGTQSVSVQTDEGLAVIPGMCSIYQTFQDPVKVLPEGHPFGAWEVFSQAIATDMNQSYYSALRLKHLADVLYPCHGPGFCEQTKEYVDR